MRLGQADLSKRSDYETDRRVKEIMVTGQSFIESKHKSAEIRYIAMIDIKKTKILAVYSSQKEAVEARNMKCNSFLTSV